MPLKRRNQTASFLVDQRERRTNVFVFKNREECLSARQCRYLKSYSASFGFFARNAIWEKYQWQSREGKPCQGRGLTDRDLVSIVLPSRTLTTRESPRASRNTITTINKDTLRMSLHFNSPRHLKVGSGSSRALITIPVEGSGTGTVLI